MYYLSEHIGRREALKRIFKAIAAVGASQFISFEDILAAEAVPARDKPHVIWLHGSSCSGCSISFMNIEYVPVIDILTQFTRVVFHPDLSLATGEQVPALIDELVRSKRPYLFVFEGGIPEGMPHACLMADKPITEWVDLLASRAQACIAAGTCATMGGVPKMPGTVTGSMTLEEYLNKRNIKVDLVNLPNCPMKPEHFVYTLLHLIKTGTFPALDNDKRPLKFFAHTVHERCIFYSSFQEHRFAQHVGDDGCLLKLGCQGPVTKNDCLITGHNGNTNTCIRAGHPCIGCASRQFPRQVMFHINREASSGGGSST